ncbi:DUF6404 family protein [Maritalea mediterranea]|uniref:DUF6404 family protein n=1 Tax=Maritalea mediterranea TaxID=2909667 RepID=A0ABS9E567_9HYPH|nr:DUF6404 family protein [Maritalea mediterranea]MCF4098003.1 DUF6404 family protein [Maritalea mediterranea]
MTFSDKLAKAQAELENCRLDSIVQLKRFDALLYRIGLPIRPVHYRESLQLFVQQTILFGLLVSASSCLLLKNIFGFSMPMPFLPLMFVSYGLIYAVFYCAQVENEREDCALSRWEDL